MSRRAFAVQRCLWVALAGVAACNDAGTDEGQTGGSEGGEPGTDGGTPPPPPAESGDPLPDGTGGGTAGAPPGPGADPEPTTTATTGDAATTGATPFIVEPDGGSSAIECDVWTQDCPQGEKCMPYTNDATSWNATKCVPIVENPKAVGDDCKVESERHSGIDDCEQASMCWDVDETTLLGGCASFCSGSPENPTCDDPGTVCAIVNDGTITLCLRTCDPLVMNCGDGRGCYLAGAGELKCFADRSEPDGGNYGDPCEYLNACHSGLFCASATAVPGCTAVGCCSSFCDFGIEDEATRNAQCEGVADGQVCELAFVEGEAPPGYETLGVCAIPV